MGLCLSKDAAGAAAAATGATGAGGAFGPVDAEAASAWFVTAKPVPEATQRLVCLPWEGGSSLAVNHLAMPFTEVVAVELPGRMARMKEPLLTRVEAIVRPLAQAMALVGYVQTPASSSTKPLPLVLMGHSYFGCILAAELAKLLVQEYGVQPHALVLSGCPAPNALPNRYPAGGLAGLKGDKLGQYLVETGAIVAHVAGNKETMKGLLPLYKADLAAVEAYLKRRLPATAAAPAAAAVSTTATPFLQCPILAVTAQGSTVATLSDMAGWAKLTTGAFTSEELAADGAGPSGGGSNHYAHMRSGATDGLVRALTLTTLGRAILMKDVVAARRWFVAHYAPRADCKYRMLCLAWAGGNSSIYKDWRIPDVEILAVELPGRNARVKEAPLKNLHTIVARFVQALEVLGYVNDPDRPLILFGHSFGAMQTLEVARLLRAKGHTPPHYLIFSGCPPSDDGWGDTGVSSKTDEGIGKYLVWLGGLTPELAANKEIMAKVLPIIRGDYTAIDTYKHADAPPIAPPTRVLALTGENDIAADAERMAGWARFCADPATQFAQVVVAGGSHFFIKDKPELVTKTLEDVVVLGKPAPEGKI